MNPDAQLSAILDSAVMTAPCVVKPERGVTRVFMQPETAGSCHPRSGLRVECGDAGDVESSFLDSTCVQIMLRPCP